MIRMRAAAAARSGRRGEENPSKCMVFHGECRKKKKGGGDGVVVVVVGFALCYTSVSPWPPSPHTLLDLPRRRKPCCCFCCCCMFSHYFAQHIATPSAAATTNVIGCDIRTHWRDRDRKPADNGPLFFNASAFSSQKMSEIK